MGEIQIIKFMVKTRCLLRNSSLSFFVLESLANRRFFIVPGEQDVQFRFQFLVLPQAVQVPYHVLLAWGVRAARHRVIPQTSCWRDFRDGNGFPTTTNDLFASTWSVRHVVFTCNPWYPDLLLLLHDTIDFSIDWLRLWPTFKQSVHCDEWISYDVNGRFGACVHGYPDRLQFFDVYRLVHILKGFRKVPTSYTQTCPLFSGLIVDDHRHIPAGRFLVSPLYIVQKTHRTTH